MAFSLDKQVEILSKFEQYIDNRLTASLEEVFGTPDLWHVALSAYVVLVIVCMLPYYWFPESPKYLFFVVKDHEAARDR